MEEKWKNELETQLLPKPDNIYDSWVNAVHFNGPNAMEWTKMYCILNC